MAPRSTAKRASKSAVTKPPAKVIKTTKPSKGIKAANGKKKAKTPDAESDSDEEHSTVSKPVTMKTTSILGTVVAKYSARASNDAAQYNDDNALYILEPLLESRKPFSLGRVMIQSGEYKGYQALVLVPVPKKQFRFQDFPPEIRTMVYRELFSEPNLELRVEGMISRGLHGVWVMPSKRWSRKSKGKGSQASSNIGVLTVSRWMFQEAAAVFYSNNINLISWKGLKIFLEDIGSCRAYIQHVTISSNHWGNNYEPQFAIRVAKLLADAKALKHLDLKIANIPCWNVDGNAPNLPNRDWLTKDLKPLLQMLHQQGKSELEILNIITWSPDQTCHEHGPGYYGRFYYRLPATGNQIDKCNNCKAQRRLYEIPVDEIKDKIVTMFAAEEELALQPKPKPKSKPKPEPEPIIRRETGRPKRGTVSQEISYIEVSDDEIEEVGEEVEVEVDGESKEYDNDDEVIVDW